MTGRTGFEVQGFAYAEGRLVTARSAPATSAPEALQQAEAWARRLPGAAAFRHEDGQAVVLGAFGDVPDAIADGLAGG